MATTEQIEKALRDVPPGTRLTLKLDDGREVPAIAGDDTTLSLEDGTSAPDHSQITQVLAPASSADPE